MMAKEHDSAGRFVVHSSPLHHGIALWPPPSTDPRDPLRWPYWVKVAALVAVALCNFSANFAGSGFAVTTHVLEAQFHKSANSVNQLLTLNFLLLGIGNMIWVPVASILGKRFSLLLSLSMLVAVLCWTAEATTFNSLLAARCISGFASAAGESVVPGIVADLFFLHERAAMMSIYVLLVAGATAIGPLLSSFIVEYSPGTWRTFSWVCTGITALNLLAVFVFYPESTFVRPVHYEVSAPPEEKETKAEAHLECLPRVDAGILHVDPVRVQWTKVWTSIWTVNKDVNITRAFSQPFIFLLYPNVLWAVMMYGCSLASQIILIFAFPTLLMAPPYLFTGTGVGLMQVAAIIGLVIGTIAGGYFSDIMTARQIRKAGGTMWPEQRLISLIPGCWVSPAGCILVACACEYKLHWIAIAFGFGMLSFGTVYGPNIAVTYVVESHPESASSTLVVINVFKNIVAFIFLYVAVEWVQSQGWIQVYMIMFMLVTLSYVLAVPVYFFGERLRRRSQRFVFRDREIS